MLSSSKPVVLVVEDEPLVRMFVTGALEDEGYKVLEAANADEALTLLQARPDVLAVITDVEMPGRSGYELAQAVHKRLPNLSLVIMSGRCWPETLPQNSVFLAKPVPAAKLVAQVRQAVEQTERRLAEPAEGSVLTITVSDDGESAPALPAAGFVSEPIFVAGAQPLQEPDRS
jgi:DNA-binding NtrC family response regulator